MGNITAKLAIGPIGFTNYLLVIHRKVSAPGIEVGRQVFGPAPTSANLVLTELDPETYFVDFRESIDGEDIGTLISTFTIDAQSNQLLQEKRYYTVGGTGDYDPADGDLSITDPYIEGKTVSSIFKEGFRDLVPTTEWERTGNTINNLTGNAYSTNEVIVVTIDYKDALPVPTATGAGMFSGTTTLTVDTTLTSDHYNNRIKCAGTIKIVTLPDHASVPNGKQFYIQSFGTTAKNVTIKCQGTDKLYFDGFGITPNEFEALWIAKGEFIFIEKQEDYFEVIDCSKGITMVGEKVSLGYASHPNILTEDASLFDGDDYPRLWWWITNVLPGTHVITDDTVTSISYAHPVNKVGLFVRHSTLKKFRMPKTVGMTEKGLANFITYGGDSARPYDYPGGFQAEQVADHYHNTSANGNNSFGVYGQDDEASLRIESYETNKVTTKRNKTGGAKGIVAIGAKNFVDNVGVIFGRRI